jgi:DNA-binding NarL/FixJ family response regulator
MVRVAIVAESPRLRSELGDVLRESGRFEVIASVPALRDFYGDDVPRPDDRGLGDGPGLRDGRSVDDARHEPGGTSADNTRRRDDDALVDAADVILTDAAATASLASKAAEESSAAFVLLSDDDELAATLRPFRTGIALLPTHASADQIVAAVEGAAAGLVVLHADHAGSLTAAPVDDPLTPREREVLHILAAGLGNKEIAARLHISDHTAKFHVSQILAKLSAASRAEAVSIAMRRGLVPL